MATIGADLQQGDAVCHHGAVHMCGWYDNQVWYQVSSAEDLEADTMFGTTAALAVCTYTPGEDEDPPRSSIEITDAGEVLVTVDRDGDMTTYRCRNLLDATPFVVVE